MALYNFFIDSYCDRADILVARNIPFSDNWIEVHRFYCGSCNFYNYVQKEIFQSQDYYSIFSFNYM